MSHHGDGRFPPANAEEVFANVMEPLEVESLQSQMREIKRRMADAGREDLGPTGEFPDGRLVPTDEGEFTYRIGSTAGKVILDFGKPMTWMGFNPEQAEQFWRAMRDHTRRAIEQQKAGAS